MNLPATNQQSSLPKPNRPHSKKNKTDGPDLIIDSFEPNPDTPVPGQKIFFDVRVKNQGNFRSEQFDVKVRGQGIKRKAQRAKALEPGQSQKFKFGPTRLRGDGLYTFEATADTENEVAETREDNNWQISIVSVKNPFPPNDPFPPRPPFPPRS